MILSFRDTSHTRIEIQLRIYIAIVYLVNYDSKTYILCHNLLIDRLLFCVFVNFNLDCLLGKENTKNLIRGKSVI